MTEVSGRCTFGIDDRRTVGGERSRLVTHHGRTVVAYIAVLSGEAINVDYPRITRRQDVESAGQAFPAQGGRTGLGIALSPGAFELDAEELRGQNVSHLHIRRVLSLAEVSYFDTVFDPVGIE